MNVRSFNEFIAEGIVKKQSPNKQRAVSLSTEAKAKKEFLEKTLKTIPPEDMNANFVIDSSYDIILESIRAKMFVTGYNSHNSHEAEVAYLRILGFSEPEVLFVNELRYYRNSIKYYGKQFDMEYAQKVLQFLEKIYEKLNGGEIKLIIFDIGGILVENYDIPFLEAMAESYKKSLEKIEKDVKPVMQASERGEITEFEFVKRFLKENNGKNDAERIIAIRRTATKEIKEMRAFIEEQKKKYQIAFATNNAQEEFAYNNKMLGLNALFDWGIASYSAHARKTEPKIFKMILKHFNVKPEETVFVDDSVANLGAPRKMGIKTIHFISLEQCKKELEKI